MPQESKEPERPKKSKEGSRRSSDGLSLDPLTFEEALAGLLATEPPAKPTTKRKRGNKKSPSRAAATPRKRKSQPHPDTKK